MNGSTGLVSKIQAWFGQPFNANGSVLQWTAFVGVIAIAAFLWSRVIRDIQLDI